MMTTMDKLFAIVIAGMLYLASTRSAFAYFETSTFWMVLQTVVAISAGGLAAIKIYWSKIVGWFRHDTDEESTDELNQ